MSMKYLVLPVAGGVVVVVVVVVGGATLSQTGYATFLPIPHAPTPRSSLM